MSENWIAQATGLGVVEVGRRLGMRLVDRVHLAPCPACKGERRSRSDQRIGPVFVAGGGHGWKCGLCGVTGDALRLAMYALLGEVIGKGSPRWTEFRRLAIGAELCTESPREQWEPPPMPPPEPRKRIEVSELSGLWDRCARADEDIEVAAWLQRRGLDPGEAAERDLCRALPREDVPRWARFMGAPWTIGWRCLVRAWDDGGRLASIRARWVKVESPPSGGDKTGVVAGASAGGAVLACGLGQQILEHGRAPDWWPPERPLEIVITEGEPDWMSWTMRLRGETAPASIGIFSGAWDPVIATRIPDGSRVVLWTHDDEAGHKYAQRIIESLKSRCRLFRRLPNTEQDDVRVA